MNHLHLGRHHATLHRLTAGLLVLVLTLTIASGRAPVTYADYNHNPIGVANDCRYVNGYTVITGWAHDPDAPAGAYPQVDVRVGTSAQRVGSSLSGYHDTLINNYLTQVRPATPHSSVYGFRAQYTGLYKGSSYSISGTILNYGSGTANAALQVDTTSNNVDGMATPSGSYAFTATKTLPDACLAPKPVTPTPTPTPTPSPSPTPTPTQSPSPKPTPTTTTRSSGSSTPTSSSSGNTSTNSGGQKSDANGTAQAGTLSAKISVPSEGAASTYLLYGTNADNLDQSSDTVSFGTDPTDVSLSGLEARTKYYYQIVRTSPKDEIGTSSTSTFETSGYAATLHFIDAKNKPVSGVEGVLNDADKTTTKSDKDGNLKFYDLDAGAYTVTYSYKKLAYTKDFDTSAAEDNTSDAGKTVVLSDTINVSTLKNGSSDALPHKKSGVGGILLLLFLIILVGGIIFWQLMRRRAQNSLYGTYGATKGAKPATAPSAPVAPAATPLPHKSKKRSEPTPSEPLEHVGESLREMVIRSMHEEAQKRKQGPGGPTA